MNLKTRGGRWKNRRIIILAVLVMMLAGGAAAYYWTRQTATASAQTTSTLQTAVARRGDLTLSASGTGSLVAGKTANLAFSASGAVAKVSVAVGDKVAEGDTLAELQDQASLKADVLAAQLTLYDAKKAVEDLKAGASATLAEAQLSLAEAKKAYTDAKAALKWKGLTRCDQETTTAYYDKYMLVQDELDRVGLTGHSAEEYLNVVAPIKAKRDQAYSAYLYCTGFTSYEIDSSQAKLAKTEAEVKKAQELVDLLQANNGINPDDLAQAENTVSQDEINLAKAQETLDGATLKAPFSGTVSAVAGEAGDKAGTGTFITLLDLSHPQIDFYLDEADMTQVAVGYQVKVSFDALPDQTFTGKVTRVEPSLVLVNGYQAVKCAAEIELPASVATRTLPEGLNASVEVIGGQAKNAVLVPVEALRDLGDGEYGVFVMNAQGKPRLKVVQVGLMDLTYAEIREGIQPGDVVTTGIQETK